jgi:hypothetical protein
MTTDTLALVGAIVGPLCGLIGGAWAAYLQYKIKALEAATAKAEARAAAAEARAASTRQKVDGLTQIVYEQTTKTSKGDMP